MLQLFIFIVIYIMEKGLEDIRVWIKALVAGISLLLLGLVFSIASIIYGATDTLGAVLSITGLGASLAGLYISLKAFTGYISARISMLSKNRDRDPD